MKLEGRQRSLHSLYPCSWVLLDRQLVHLRAPLFILLSLPFLFLSQTLTKLGVVSILIDRKGLSMWRGHMGSMGLIVYISP